MQTTKGIPLFLRISIFLLFFADFSAFISSSSFPFISDGIRVKFLYPSGSLFMSENTILVACASIVLSFEAHTMIFWYIWSVFCIHTSSSAPITPSLS